MKKTDGIPTIPLFPLTAALSAAVREKVKPVRAYTHAVCPHCSGGNEGLVALVQTGGHLVWRNHTYRTWSGVEVPCQSSGVAVCVAPTRRPTPPGKHEAVCPHDLA